VLKSENIELNQNLVNSTIEEMAIAYEQPDQVRDYYRQNQQARSSVESMVLEEQVVDHILDKANVTEKDANFTDLMDGKL
jgi:trigger factor